jgi:hypothetical protein
MTILSRLLQDLPSLQIAIAAALWRASSRAADAPLACAATYTISAVVLSLFAGLTRNAHESILSRASFGLLGTPHFVVGGTVAPGFERIEAMFRAQFKQGLHRSAQICVYAAGQKVVDLYGSVRGKGLERANEPDPDPCASTFHGRAPSAPDSAHGAYDGDSMQLCFSSTKSLAAVVDPGARSDLPRVHISGPRGHHAQQSTSQGLPLMSRQPHRHRCRGPCALEIGRSNLHH